mmetsp:Transcript_2256/g.7505  ORF Transcript_2256/g.7505 Transcript_2256/m.7505 type:complete len:301 (+) Transcript_2256:214-1116(+)
MDDVARQPVVSLDGSRHRRRCRGRPPPPSPYRLANREPRRWRRRRRRRGPAAESAGSAARTRPHQRARLGFRVPPTPTPSKHHLHTLHLDDGVGRRGRAPPAAQEHVTHALAARAPARPVSQHLLLHNDAARGAARGARGARAAVRDALTADVDALRQRDAVERRGRRHRVRAPALEREPVTGAQRRQRLRALQHAVQAVAGGAPQRGGDGGTGVRRERRGGVGGRSGVDGRQRAVAEVTTVHVLQLSPLLAPDLATARGLAAAAGEGAHDRVLRAVVVGHLGPDLNVAPGDERLVVRPP